MISKAVSKACVNIRRPPLAGMAAGQALVTGPAAAALAYKGIKVGCRADWRNGVWVILADHRQLLANAVVLLQHVNNLQQTLTGLDARNRTPVTMTGQG